MKTAQLCKIPSHKKESKQKQARQERTKMGFGEAGELILTITNAYKTYLTIIEINLVLHRSRSWSLNWKPCGGWEKQDNWLDIYPPPLKPCLSYAEWRLNPALRLEIVKILIIQEIAIKMLTKLLSSFITTNVSVQHFSK